MLLLVLLPMLLPTLLMSLLISLSGPLISDVSPDRTQLYSIVATIERLVSVSACPGIAGTSTHPHSQTRAVEISRNSNKCLYLVL